MRRHGIAVGVALLLGAAGGPATASAQPGALDGSFGAGGVVTTGSAQLLGVAVQANGEVVAAGQSGGNVVVERFTPAGQPDGSYTGGPGVARAVAIAPGGDIVIAGANGSGAMLVERLSSSLTLKWAATAFAGQGGVANGVATTPGGAIVAVGALGSFPSTAAAAEFTSSGGTAWAQTYGLGGNASLAADAVEPDGTIVAVGKRNPTQVVDALVVLIGAGGNQANAAIYDYPGSGGNGFGGVGLTSNGEIVADGQTSQNGLSATMFVRFSSSLGVDTTFGHGGVVVLPATQNLSNDRGVLIGANGLGIAGGGALVGAGPLEHGAAEIDAALWGVSAGGTPDGSFGGGDNIAPGTATGPPTASQTGNFEGCAVAIAPDGSPDAGEIVTVGDTFSRVPSNYEPCAAGAASSGYVASYTGYGPPPPPPSGTTGGPPAVTTGAASLITDTSERVAGEVNPNGLATTYHFVYGTSTSYGSSTAAVSAGSGSVASAVSATLSGLQPNTTYHYQLVASNADGTVEGADQTFTTAAPGTTAKPIVTTGGTASRGEVWGRLLGTVNANGLPTTYRFEYGRTTRYGSSTSGRTSTASLDGAVSALIRHLRPGTKYHYRIVASNAAGSATGKDRTFRTQPRLVARLKAVRGSLRIGAVLAHGLTIVVSCSQSCAVDASLQVSGATARALGLGRHPSTVATGGGRAAAGKTTTIVVRVSRSAASAIAKQSTLPVTLRVVSRPRYGGPSVQTSRTLTLRK